MPAIGVSVGVGHRRRGFRPLALFDALASTSLPAWLSHSRPSLAMMFDSTGKLTYAPNNLLTYSNTFSNAVWAKNNGGTGVAPIITANAGTDPVGGNAASRIQFSRTNNTQADYSLISQGGYGTSANNISGVWLKSNTGISQNVVLYDGYRLIGRVITVTTSWQLFSQSTLGSASSNSNITFGTYGGTGNFYNGGDATIDVLAYAAFASAVTYETSPRTADQVITTSAAYYGPRIDYDPNTLAVKGLLIEEARTNLVVNSNQFTSWTISGGSSVATNSNTQIDGTTNGNTFSLVAGSTGHQIYKSYTGTAAAYTNSVYAKAGTSSWLGMWFASTAQADGAFFNLSNGTIGTIAAGTTAAIQSIGNGWYRCSITKTLTAATYYNGLEVHTADNQAYNFSAAGTESLYLFGAQAELGFFATSYIPTAASSVTRAGDVPAAATYSSNPAIIQYRSQSTGTRARKVINPWSGISSETNEWIEGIRIYPLGTSPTWLNAHLTVDGAW